MPDWDKAATVDDDCDSAKAGKWTRSSIAHVKVVVVCGPC